MEDYWGAVEVGLDGPVLDVGVWWDWGCVGASWVDICLDGLV